MSANDITEEFLESTIKACKRDQERLRMDFERQEGVVRFCELLIKRMRPDEKETTLPIAQ